MELKPVIKWIGGKTTILEKLKPFVPSNYDTYIEPFVGSGAMLLSLAPHDAIINDVNDKLINMYEIVKKHPDELLQLLSTWKNEERRYYEIRSWDRDKSVWNGKTDIEKAARFIYLDKTGFNGLYRENSKGENNVSFAHYKHPAIYDENRIRDLSRYLNDNNVTMMSADYKEVLALAQPQYFVYCDPPYDDDKANNSFTSYSKYGFNRNNQMELKAQLDMLDIYNVKFMLSNADTEFINELYGDYHIEHLSTTRCISYGNNAIKNTARRNAGEVLVMNY